MEYRGFLIAKLADGADRYYPWAYGMVGRGITGWAHTRREAKAQIDRMLAGHNPDECGECAEREFITQR